MLILEDLSIEVPDTNAHHWKLKEFSEASTTDVLMYGYNSSANTAFQQQCQDYKRRIFFNNWAPCEFAQYLPHNNQAPTDYEGYFNEVYSICPYTVDWMNEQNLGRTYKNIFYPFRREIVPGLSSKEYDVIYHGGIHGQEHLNCLMVMREFNYRYVTMTHHINGPTQQCLPLATDVNLNFADKLALVAKSKISVCYNLVHIAPDHIAPMQSHKNWKDNGALAEAGRDNVMPQFKTRAHEGAISRTLNLVYRDKWNVMENYYEPDTEFIYFNDERDLRHKITDILNNWNSYEEVIEAAYQRALHYTTAKFVKIIKDGKEWKR